jgi:hypothetical protein
MGGKKPAETAAALSWSCMSVQGVERVSGREHSRAMLSPRHLETVDRLANEAVAQRGRPCSTYPLSPRQSPTRWHRTSAASPHQPVDRDDWLLIPSHTSKLKTGKEPDQGRCHDVWKSVSAIHASYDVAGP